MAKKTDWLNALGAALSSGTRAYGQARERKQRQKLIEEERGYRRRAEERDIAQQKFQKKATKAKLRMQQQRMSGAGASGVAPPGSAPEDDALMGMLDQALLSSLGETKGSKEFLDTESLQELVQRAREHYDDPESQVKFISGALMRIATDVIGGTEMLMSDSKTKQRMMQVVGEWVKQTTLKALPVVEEEHGIDLQQVAETKARQARAAEREPMLRGRIPTDRGSMLRFPSHMYGGTNESAMAGGPGEDPFGFGGMLYLLRGLTGASGPAIPGTFRGGAAPPVRITPSETWAMDQLSQPPGTVAPSPLLQPEQVPGFDLGAFQKRWGLEPSMTAGAAPSPATGGQDLMQQILALYGLGG